MSEDTTSTTLAPVVVEFPEQVKALVKSIKVETAEEILGQYKPFFAAVDDLLQQAKRVEVTDATQVTMIRHSRELRLKLREQRTAADKTRKAMKEESLRLGKAIDGVYSFFELMVKPVEDKLLAAEEFAERAEQKRLEERKAKRIAELAPLGVDPQFYDLLTMPDDVFEKLLAGAKQASEALAAKKKQEEEERIREEEKRQAQLKSEAEERERIRVENARLKKEAEEREAAAAAERERIAKEKKEAEARAAAAEAKAKEEAAAAEKRRLAEIDWLEKEARERTEKALEEQRRANAEANRKAKEERERQEAEQRAEVAKKQQQQAAEVKKFKAIAEEEKRKADDLAAKVKREKDEQEMRAGMAAAAPDKEKIKNYAANVRTWPLPAVSTPAARAIVDVIGEQREKLAAWIDKQAASL